MGSFERVRVLRTVISWQCGLSPSKGYDYPSPIDIMYFFVISND